MAATPSAGVEALHRLKQTEPPMYLTPSSELANAARIASEHIFALLKPYTPKSPFDRLLVDDKFDAEQIWQQIDLQSQPLISAIRRQVNKLEKDPVELKNIFKSGESEQERKRELVLQGEKEQDEDDDDDDDEEEDEYEMEDDEDEEEEEEEKGVKEGGGADGVEDKFLNIEDMKEFMEDDEAREYEINKKKQVVKNLARKHEEDDEEDDDEDDELGYTPAIDIVICTAMISGYVLNGMNSEALQTFRWLINHQMRPNAITLSSTLPACAGLANLELGNELHGQIVKNGVERCHVGTSIIYMYAKCGRIDLAHQVFDKMSERDTVCWNSMITGFCQNGEPEQAIDIFREMGSGYDSVTISAVLFACANLPLLSFGKAINGFMTRGTLKTDLYAESALIDMYAKCGNLESARTVFDVMEKKSEVPWNSIISAYGNHGRLQECLNLFHQMEDSGFHPDHVTFHAIISACDHSGLVDHGLRYFKSMTEDYGIAPGKEHYACVIDLYGRAGRLSEAFETVKSMSFKPDAGIWGTLLGACRVHGDVELAEMASRHLFEMDPGNLGYYVLLSNVQADAGKWEGVGRTRSMMKDRGVKKVPGYSSIEVNNEMFVFGAADKGNPRSDEVYMLLKNFLLVVKEEELCM